MPVRFQLVIDCADPDRLARFWAAALGYELAPAPAGFATWNDFYRELAVKNRRQLDIHASGERTDPTNRRNLQALGTADE